MLGGHVIMKALLLVMLAGVAHCQELAYAVPATQPLVVYMNLPDPLAYDYGAPVQAPMPYSQAQKEMNCPYGYTKFGICRSEPLKFCPYGVDMQGNCYPMSIHCRYGYDQFGDCIRPPYIPVPQKL